METLAFKVDGEFVCHLARDWFWEDGKPFEKCMELLIECLGTDMIGMEEKKSIAIDILEGKKILKGLNVFTLEEDGEYIRPLTDKIKENERKLAIYHIKEEMEKFPERYVDIYACPKNMEEYAPIPFTDWRDPNEIPLLQSEKEMVRLWLYASENWYSGKYSLEDEYFYPKKHTDNGAYLMDPVLVYEVAGDTINNVGDSIFYEKLYEYWEKHPKKSGIEERQRLYEAEMEKNKKPPIDNSEIEEIKNKELYCISQPDVKIKGKYISEYGLIDRRGYYYSCGYAGHNAKAMTIISENPELFDIKETDLYKKNDRMLDILLEKGWIIVRNPAVNGDPYFDMSQSNVATKAQIKAVFDYMAHFNRKDVKGLDNVMKTEA